MFSFSFENGNFEIFELFEKRDLCLNFFQAGIFSVIFRS